MTPPLSDARLARQATGGDRRAFAAIYKRYHQDLYRFCLSLLGRPEDAQEALQNTMVKAMRSLPGEEREIQLRPWLYRVAHNESIDLLRRRREGLELESVPLSDATEIAETVATRERLGRLLGDLKELPTRQRSALIMRELGGLDYEQIGEAFKTSGPAARQTVYEARLGLREIESGREMSCEQVTRQLSEADGRTFRRRDVQAHLRGCAGCRAFRDAIKSRRQDLAALAPLPAAAAGAISTGLGGSQAAIGGGGLGGGAAGAAGAGIGKAATSSVALKAVATVAIVATAGVTAADRIGLIDVGLPRGESGSAVVHASDPPGQGASAPVPAEEPSSEGSSKNRARVNGASIAGGTHQHRPEITTPEFRPLSPAQSASGHGDATESASPSSPASASPSAHGKKAVTDKTDSGKHLGQANGHAAKAKQKGHDATESHGQTKPFQPSPPPGNSNQGHRSGTHHGQSQPGSADPGTASKAKGNGKPASGPVEKEKPGKTGSAGAKSEKPPEEASPAAKSEAEPLP